MTQQIKFGPWRTSSYSATDGNCVKLAWAAGAVLGVCDSKWAGEGPAPTLVFSPEAAASLRAVAALRPVNPDEVSGT